MTTKQCAGGDFITEDNALLKPTHRSTMFRGYFKIAENFLYLLEKCRGEKVTLSAEDFIPFDLESEVAKRVRRNDVSFITKDGRIIILIEHQSTINPNMAFRLFMYYNELLQLWIKQSGKNLFAANKIVDFPTPEFYVVYNGSKKLKENFSTFVLESENLKIFAKVEIIDIHFDKLADTKTENSLAGYAFFYKEHDAALKLGLSNDKAYEHARQICIEKGYMQGFVEKEEFTLFYKDFLDYDEQLKAEGKAEGEVKGEVKGTESSIIVAIKNNASWSLIEALAKSANISKERVDELNKVATAY